MDAKPYFSKKLLCTAPDGTYATFGGSKRISAYPDRIEIGTIAIPNARVIDIIVMGNVLHIVFCTAEGKRTEQYFRYDTFLPRKANRELMAFLETASSYLPRTPATSDASSSHADAVVAPAAERARRTAPVRGREAVVVFSGSVAFPPCCPACLGPVSRVARLNVGTGFQDIGFWLVPVCREHRSVAPAISVHGWKARSSEITFSFARSEYADRFLRLNQNPELKPFASEAEASEIMHDVRLGIHFVTYQFVISFVYVALLRTSNVSRVNGKGEAVLRGLPYSLSTLLVGLWSIPGLVWTPMAIYRNLRGGIDLTSAVEQAVSGIPVSARGV